MTAAMPPRTSTAFGRPGPAPATRDGPDHASSRAEPRLVVHLLDPHEESADVVRTATAVRQVNHPPASHLRIWLALHDLPDVRITDLSPQPVRAQKEHVTYPHWCGYVSDVDLDLGLRSQRSSQNVRVGGPTISHGVVGGEALCSPVSDAIGPRVTDVGNPGVGAAEDKGGARCTHAVQFRRCGRLGVDRLIGSCHAELERCC